MCAANLGAIVSDRPAGDGLTITLSVNEEPSFRNQSHINLLMEDWQDEATLFAQSGLAALLGDPDREPLVPAANFATHSVGYALFGAITALYAKWIHHNEYDTVSVHAVPALTWVNWKAVAGGQMGIDMVRKGELSEWPMMTCKNGFVAFLFTERDWGRVKKLIGDPRLEDPKFGSFAGRAEHRNEYIPILKNWCIQYTQSELNEIFLKNAIPGAALLTIEDLFDDALLKHRNTFSPSGSIQPPHRVAKSAKSKTSHPGFFKKTDKTLPLSGIRVLDLGIITAGAGVGHVLADLGAEVLKIESETYPDPFRQWAGATEGDSPLFKFNNRNKYGLALDLKTDQGRSDFIALVKSADLVLENFRRGVLDRLGFTFEELKKHNDRILLASISGQGLDGPGAKHTTFGSTLEASSGFAWLTKYEDGLPYISGRQLNYPDQTVVLYAAALITAAITDCKASGIARHLDISQRDAAIYQIFDVIKDVRHGKTDQTAYQDRQQIFKTSDNRYFALSATTIGAIMTSEVMASRDDFKEWAGRLSADELLQACRDVGSEAAECLIGKALFRQGISISTQKHTNDHLG